MVRKARLQSENRVTKTGSLKLGQRAFVTNIRGYYSLILFSYFLA
jgi:hypothetical protein